MEDYFLTHLEAAKLLKISDPALERHIRSDNPPPMCFIGKVRRYPRKELIEWAMASQTNPYHQKPQADSE